MVAKRSAGLLIWRRTPDGGVEVLLGHMGGPLWARRDERAWSLPKGEYGLDEDALHAARREFAEELGRPAPPGPVTPLGEVRQSVGKTVVAWALEDALGDWSAVAADGVLSNTVTLEWPRGSGRLVEFPEIDRAGWFDPPTARRKLIAAQADFVDRLVEQVAP